MDEIVSMLRKAIDEPGSLVQMIPRIQHAVLKESLTGSSAVEEILRDLAYDLDYFEPDPRARSEDPSFIDEEKARAEIEVALRRIDQVGQ